MHKVFSTKPENSNIGSEKINDLLPKKAGRPSRGPGPFEQLSSVLHKAHKPSDPPLDALKNAHEKFEDPRSVADWILANPDKFKIYTLDDNVPDTAKDVSKYGFDAAAKELNSFVANNPELLKNATVNAISRTGSRTRSIGSDMGFGAKEKDPIRYVVQPEIKNIKGATSNMERALKIGESFLRDQHSDKPIVVDFIFSPQELAELERALDELEREELQHKKIFQDTKTNLNFGRNEDMSKNGWYAESDGTQKCYKDGKLHCDNGPAEVRPNGTQLFYKNGKLHRDGNLPAMVGVGGTKKYAVNGKYHRVGGEPAIIWSKSPYAKEWWVNGEIQKAVKRDGVIEHYAPGCNERDEARFHREDGPAVIFPNGREEFWLEGVQYPSRADWEYELTHLHNARQQRIQQLDKDLIDEDPIDEVTSSVSENSQTTTKKAEKTTKMNKPSFTDTLKANAASAGYRVAAKQSTKIVKNAILTIMRNKGADNGAIQGISSFLDTEFGEALVAFALGSGLHYVPHFSDDPRVQRLGEEMRIDGMATAGNAVIGEAMAHVLPALTQVLQNLPAADTGTSNVRVEETKDSSKLLEALEEENTQTEEVAPKVAKA